jgi:anti-sigma factor RsiW
MSLEAYSGDCGRARRWAALAPDGELSMLELRLLQVHLQRCPACARVATDIEAISDAIRSAPLEAPSAQVALPVLRRATLLNRTPSVRSVGRLAAVAVGGLLAFTVGSWTSDETVATLPVRPIVIDNTDFAAVNAEPAELRAFRRAELLSETSVAPRLGVHPGPQPL